MAERTIGQLAHDAGVGIETIRYYQRIGLISKPPRAFNGWRHYPERTFRLLQYVRQGQQCGFSLRELQNLLGQSPADAPRLCSAFRAAIEKKIAELDAEMARIRTHRSQLCNFVKACSEQQNSRRCPIVEDLA